jgi:hypothetical protein
MSKVAIVQSNFIPWKGYFDLIAYVDAFVIYDDMQYTRRDWRNRNKIKTPSGPQWLTMPVNTKGKYYQKINETTVSNPEWGIEAWKKIEYNYSRSTYFNEISLQLQDLFINPKSLYLSQINKSFIGRTNSYLGIKTVMYDSGEFLLKGERSEKLMNIVKDIGGRCYVSGPSAKGYLDVSLFRSNGLTVEWFDYTGYPSYQQLWGEFIHELSVIDLLFNCGPNSPEYLKHLKP